MVGRIRRLPRNDTSNLQSLVTDGYILRDWLWIQVLSLSIGASCRFLYKQNEDDKPEEVLLESGDALIFGGPCRYILHAVKRIYDADTAPEWLRLPHPLGGGRLNFTFRYAPEAFGREGEYR